MRTTEQTHWEHYWIRLKLPAEIKRTDGRLFINAILDVFDRFLPKGRSFSMLEIGGAPGQYLAYFAKRYGCDVSCLDYSRSGCGKTRENFKLLGIQGRVYERDLFDDTEDLPAFDVVYSLGFLEHFLDLEKVVERHLRFLKPGGLLVLGVPNLLGINGWFLKKLAPGFLQLHNKDAMKPDRWKAFELKFKLRVLTKGYIGGLEPGVFDKNERKSKGSRLVKTCIHVLTLSMRSRLGILRKFNSRHFSGYLMGLYQQS